MRISKTKGLTVSDVKSDNGCGKAIADVENVIAHRGTSSPLILQAMKAGGPAFLDAVTTYEKNVIGFNRQNPDSPWGQMVTIYPQDGTVVANQSFAILNRASWVSDEQVEAAELFRDFLFTKEQHGLLLEHGLRPSDTEDDHLSTFGLDVDTASYTVMRRFVLNGQLPNPDSVRVEEFVNYFEQEYESSSEDAPAIHIEGTPSPFGRISTG
jgi:hypothetical protein